MVNTLKQAYLGIQKEWGWELFIGSVVGILILIPDSQTHLLNWPWILIWQCVLAYPWIWGLRQSWIPGDGIEPLGNNLGWIWRISLLAIIRSAIRAPFQQVALGWAWIAASGLVFLHPLSHALNTPLRRLHGLRGLGGFHLGFIGLSLLAWVKQVFFEHSFDNQEPLSLWHHGYPLSDPEALAGYLLLALPLLVGLGYLAQPKHRWIWAVGVGGGILNLMTTGQGGLGLALLCLIYLGILSYQKKQLQILGLAILTLGLLAGLIWVYPPLTHFFLEIHYQPLSDFWINYLVAWKMAQNYLTGVGLGGVTFLFQSFRPHWAGLILPFQTQLDSLPGHLLAELGIIGILAWLGLLGWFIICGTVWLRKFSRIPYLDQVLSLALLAGLFCYGIMSFGTFQLNTVAISGSLLITISTLAAQFRSSPTELVPSEQGKKVRPRWRIRRSKILWGVGVGLVVAAFLWQIPIVQSRALVYPDTGSISRLEQAANQVPWDPAYPYQLTWILGNDLFLHPDQATITLPKTLTWMERAATLTPYWEVAQTNLAWLYFQSSPLDPRATERFTTSARLLPAQPWVFYGLGLSLLAQGRLDPATVAFSLEILRHPATITSPLWQNPSLQPLYPQVLRQLEDTSTQLLRQASPEMGIYLQQVRGSIRWWSGNLSGAKEDWDLTRFSIGEVILDLENAKTLLEQVRQNSQHSQDSQQGSKWIIAAWMDPINRISFLEKAWIQAKLPPPPHATLQAIAESMNQASSFDHWIKTLAPTQTYRPQRSYLNQGLGLGDEILFQDFFEVSDNVIIRDLCSDLFPQAIYLPELDRILEPLQTQLLNLLQPDPIPLRQGVKVFGF